MTIQPLIDKVEANKTMRMLLGLCPIYIFFALTTVFYSNYWFIDNLGWIVMPVLTAYTVVLMVYNLFAGNLKCDKLLGISALAFFAFELISYLVVQDPTGRARDYALMIPINGLVLGAAWLRLDERKRLAPVEACFAVFATVVTLWNLINMVFHVESLGSGRLTGFTANPVRLSEMTSIAMIMICMFFSTRKVTWERIACVVAFIINGLTMYFANGRGPLMGLMAGLVVFALFISSKVLKKKTFIIVLCLVVMLCLVVGLSIVFSRMDISDFSFDIATIDTLITKRTQIYLDGIHMITEDPFRGHSIPEFRELPSYGGTDRYHFHNIFLDLGARYGILAAAAFMVFVVGIIVYSIKGLCKMDRKSLFSTSGLTYLASFSIFICILVQNQTDVYIFFNGYSACNCFFYITAGVLTYWAGKRHMETKA